MTLRAPTDRGFGNRRDALLGIDISTETRSSASHLIVGGHRGRHFVDKVSDFRPFAAMKRPIHYPAMASR